MPVVRVETFIASSPERCFDLARDVAAHIASTSASRERVVAGRTSGLLDLGEEVTWEATHLGVRQRLTARITRLERPRVFVDEMVRGAFARFTHTHEFHERPGGTLMVDLFDFESPFAWLGRVADALFLTRYMRRFLEVRAATLRAMAEGGGARDA